MSYISTYHSNKTHLGGTKRNRPPLEMLKMLKTWSLDPADIISCFKTIRNSFLKKSHNFGLTMLNIVKLLAITMNWVDTSKHHTAIHFFGLAMDSPVPRGVCGTATPTPRSSPGNETWRRRLSCETQRRFAVCGWPTADFDWKSHDDWRI